MASTVERDVAPGYASTTARPGAWVTDALLVLMAMIWGVNFSVVKFATTVMSPLAFNSMRVAIAAVALLALGSAIRSAWPSRRDTLTLLALGVLGNGLYQLFFIEGMDRTRAGTAALLLAASPAFIALAGRIRGVEHITPRGWSGIALQIAGMACVVIGGAATPVAGGSMLGNLLILGGALSWAAFTVMLKPYTHRVHGIQLSAITMVGGAIPLLLWSSGEIVGTDWTGLSGSAWGAIAYSGFLALVVAYLIYYHGVRMIGPTRTAMYANLQPLIALIVAWMVLSEAPTVWQIVGAGAIMTGLLMTRS